MISYFRLQYKIIIRRCKDAGIPPIAAYTMLPVVFIALSSLLFYKTEFAAYIYVLLALTFVGKLSERRRNDFIKVCFGNAHHKRIRLAENFICSLPFLIYLWYAQYHAIALVLFTASMVLAIINLHTTSQFVIPTPFSKRPFEFATGFRNTFYFFSAAYMLTFISVSVSNFNLGLFAMLLVYIIASGFYTKPEPEYYVWIHSHSARQFLLSKIQTALLFSFLLVLPIALVLSFFYFQSTGLILLLLLAGSAFLTYMICSKYAAYPDEFNITQAILLALCIGFPPLLVVFIPYTFLKSENRLRALLK